LKISFANHKFLSLGILINLPLILRENLLLISCSKIENTTLAKSIILPSKTLFSFTCDSTLLPQPMNNILGLRVVEWVILYLFEHTCQDF
jgi:hypothetical protein